MQILGINFGFESSCDLSCTISLSHNILQMSFSAKLVSNIYLKFVFFKPEAEKKPHIYVVAASTATCAGLRCSLAASPAKGQDANVHMLASGDSHCPLAFPAMQMGAVGPPQPGPGERSQTKRKLTCADGQLITALACSRWLRQFLTAGFLDWLNLSRLAPFARFNLK